MSKTIRCDFFGTICLVSGMVAEIILIDDIIAGYHGWRLINFAVAPWNMFWGVHILLKEMRNK